MSKIVRLMCGIGGLGAIGVGAVGLAIAFAAVHVVLWNTASFSAIAAASGVAVLFVAAGRLSTGRGITLLLAAAVVGAGAVLGRIEAMPNLTAAPAWRGVVNLWVPAAAGVALALTGLAALDAISRRPAASLGQLRRAGVAALPLAGLVAAGWWIFATPGGAALGSVARIAYAVLGGAAVIALVSALGHCLITAFEAAEDPAPRA